MERHRIGIVIPAYNEAATIAAIATNASKFGSPIIVDDGSDDDTVKQASVDGATVVSHSLNQGYDQALNTGFAHAQKAGYEYIITLDADGQHDPDTLISFIQALDDGADVVIGIRDKHQRLAEQIFAWLASIKWGIKDPLCGMKAYRINVYNSLGHFDSYNSIGTELAIHAAKNGRKITQIAIKTAQRQDSPRFGRRFSANRSILRALWLALLPSSKKLA